MDWSSIRQISHFARCGFVERLKDPHIVCPVIVELLTRYSSNCEYPDHVNNHTKNEKKIRICLLHILATYARIFSFDTVQILSNQSFICSINSIFEIAIDENHKDKTSETEILLSLIVFHLIEREQPMLCRVANKSGLLDRLIQIFNKPNDECLTVRIKSAVLRTIIRLIRISPKAAASSWVKLKKQVIDFIFSDDISMRIWGLKYVLTVIKMIEVNSKDGLALECIQPLQLCPSIFVLMYDECVPVRQQSILTICRIIISHENEKECTQLVYMGVIGLLLDVLKQNELMNYANHIAIPVLISLNKLVKHSEKWAFILINSKGIDTILSYLKYPAENIIIAVILILFNVSNHSSFHTNKVLEFKALHKLHRIKEIVNSNEFTRIIGKVIYSLIMMCTEYEILRSFIMNSGDSQIIENESIQIHLKSIQKSFTRLQKFMDSNVKMKY
ncbi:hypothetical protein OIY81_1206 [Cryptosporidium canis]|uniref:Uncharacterized protein n=1 Tax=Cryptosporidium canis TaxID=195482 RepID=A0ABQ8P8I3_9CRYT|nr:hypothetical protein OJ252_2114 [Cryptosporidium canis]KAJ1612657.1 hypothetical protein OIY81_1206 [Cryptosporidium canis]